VYVAYKPSPTNLERRDWFGSRRGVRLADLRLLDQGSRANVSVSSPCRGLTTGPTARGFGERASHRIGQEAYRGQGVTTLDDFYPLSCGGGCDSWGNAYDRFPFQTRQHRQRARLARCISFRVSCFKYIVGAIRRAWARLLCPSPNISVPHEISSRSVPQRVSKRSVPYPHWYYLPRGFFRCWASRDCRNKEIVG